MDDSEQNRAGNGEQQDPGTGRFLPGNRANPGGRPKGLSALIRARSKDGVGGDLVEFLFDVKEGNVTEPVVYKGETFEVGASVKDRMTATTYLADQLWGRSRQVVTVTDGGGELEELSDADFKRAFAEQVAADPELMALALAKRGAKPPEGG